MELDLSKLGIDTTDTTEGEISHVTTNKVELPTDPAKVPEKAPQEATVDALGSDPAADPAEVVRQIREEPPEGLGKLQTAAERRRVDLQRYREAYKEYQDNIRRAKTLREEITLGARAGTDPATLLLQAVECIAAMTGDNYYFTNFKAIMDNMTA